MNIIKFLTPKKKNKYYDMLVFFLPLAITPFFISFMHSLVNASMARLPYPELSIAIFSVVRSTSNTIRAPTRMIMQTYIAMAKDQKSFYLVTKFIWLISTLIFIILFSFGFTPLGEIFLRNIIGLEDLEAIKFAYIGFRITCFLPILETIRNANRGLAISNGITKIIPIGTTIRLVVILFFLIISVKTQYFLGVTAASLAWTLGIGIEGLVVLACIIYYFSSPLKASIQSSKVTIKNIGTKNILKFFVPLAIMAILLQFLIPIIQSGITRSPGNKTINLATFGVTYELMRVFTDPLRNLHQCSLVFVKNNKDSWFIVKRFCLYSGFIITTIMLVIAITPIGYWILSYLIGVSKDIANTGRIVFFVFSFLPLIRSIKEAHWGLLMENQNTKLIGIAKTINVLVVFVFLLISNISLLSKIEFSFAVVAAISYTAGELIETIIISYYSNKYLKMALKSDSIG